MVEGGIEGNIAETVPQSHCFACIFQELSVKDRAKGGQALDMTDTKTGRQLTDTGCSEGSRPVLFFKQKIYRSSSM